MELNKFLERFLPDYREKMIKAIFEAPIFYDTEQKNLWACHTLFPEALQNYTDKICAKQRENCLDRFLNATINFGGSVNGRQCDAILNGKQPKTV